MFRVKICGITSLSDAVAASSAGADALGLNFYPASPRYIAPEAAAKISAALPAHVTRVGLFVNESPGTIAELRSAVGLDMVQLHGDESPEVVAALSGVPVIKAFRAASDDFPRIEAFVQGCLDLEAPLAAILIDACVPGAYGGTGQKADWNLASRLRQLLAPLPLILAGGLVPENVADAIAAVQPHGVDTASGVEASPGVKDAARVARFVTAARDALTASESFR